LRIFDLAAARGLATKFTIGCAGLGVDCHTVSGEPSAIHNTKKRVKFIDSKKRNIFSNRAAMQKSSLKT
jgi:hypothetical protein